MKLYLLILGSVVEEDDTVHTVLTPFIVPACNWDAAEALADRVAEKLGVDVLEPPVEVGTF